jgi:hypothetical protein
LCVCVFVLDEATEHRSSNDGCHITAPYYWNTTDWY